MSQENVENVRLLGTAFRTRDWATAADVLHPEIEMDVTRSPIVGHAHIYRGLDEVARFWAEWLEAWGGVDLEDPELIDAGDQVLSWTTHQIMRGRGSGIEVEMPEFGWLTGFHDGKVVWATLYLDKNEALKAAGLSK